MALAQILNQPETLKNVGKEMDIVVGKDRLIQEPDIPHLNYIKACVRESFRLYPIAPFNLPHVSIKDTTIGFYFIPKGSHVPISRLRLGRNPKIWNEPLKFMPERHLKDDGSDVVLVDHELRMLDVVLVDHELRMLSLPLVDVDARKVLLNSTITMMLLALILEGFTWSIPGDVSNIDLAESKSDLFLAKPLAAMKKLWLVENVYPAN